MSVMHKVAAAATAVAALGALALGAGAAHATTAEGITITAGENMTLGGRTFSAYLIGNYTDIVQAGGKVTSFNVVGTAASTTHPYRHGRHCLSRVRTNTTRANCSPPSIPVPANTVRDVPCPPQAGLFPIGTG